jgi:ankyrin repeat protein
VDAANDSGETPLIVGAAYGDTDSVKLLLQSGANPNAMNSNGYTPLILASEMGGYEKVKDLIKAGANVNAETVIGETAVYVASRKKHDAVLQLLLDNGGNPKNIYKAK